MPDGRLVLFVHVDGAEAGNRVFELKPDAPLGKGTRVPFARPFTSYFTASPRAGGRPSDVVDLLGVRAGTENTISYARVRLR